MNKRYLTLLLGLLMGLNLPVSAASGASTEQRLERLERRVARVTDLTLALDSVREENRRLRGDIENLRYELEQLRRKQRDIYLDVDQRLSNLNRGQPASGKSAPPAGGGAAATGAKPGGDTPTPSVKTAQPTPATDEVRAEYQAAYALLGPQVRRYEDAAKAFSDFVKKYPQSSLAANAQYWLGESYYVSQKNAEALAAFDKLVKDYPDSAKMPGALYKIGRIHASSGDRKKAGEALNRVVKEYPDSPAASLARDQLNRLQKGH